MIMLPNPQPSRYWTANRKGSVVNAVNSHTTSFAKACKEHDISAEELKSWIDRRANGYPLKATFRARPSVGIAR